MHPLAFSAVDLAGSAVWSVTVGLAGVAIGHTLGLLVTDLRTQEGLVAGALLLAVLLVLAFRGRDWKTGAIVEHEIEDTLRHESKGPS